MLYDENGDARFGTGARLPMDTPRRGWAQQDPDEIVRAAEEAIHTALVEVHEGESIVAVSFSAQMYSIMAVDRSGTPLTASIPWADTRAAVEADTLRADSGAPELCAATGCPIQAAYPLAKIRWLRANADLPDDAVYISIKDYVVAKLTGHLLADWSTSSASGLLDVHTRTWSVAALEAAGVSEANLPTLAAPRTLLTMSDSGSLSGLGLPAGTSIVLGAGDAPLSSLGGGAVRPDILTVNIGTSAAARRMTAEPTIDATGGLWTYVAPEDRWVTGGIIGSAGSVYDWVVELAIPRTQSRADAYAQAGELAGSIPPGADGLMFAPYFVGRQSPDWQASARGAILGLTLHHRPAHLVRAAIEGIVFALQRVRVAIEALDGAPSLREVVMTGGVTTSPLVRQITADILGLPIIDTAGHEGSARGAAILAWVALGAERDIDTFDQSWLADAARIVPSDDAHEIYRSLFEVFVDVTNRAGSIPHTKETRQ
jgi:gluconokinase